MPTSAPGSRPLHHTDPRARRRRAGGFTLIELLVVIAIIALSAGLIVLALPDSAGRQLEQEAERLGVLLEGARAESRGSGTSVVWMPAGEEGADDFRFVGLRPGAALPTRWLDPRVSAQVVGSNVVVLGPDAILAPQRIVLRLDDRRVELATDGLAPFAVAAAPAGDPP